MITQMLRLFPKDVEVYIVGTGNYSGRVKIGTFAINAAVIEAADITVPEKVQYNGSLQTASDYMDGKVTVKAGATGKKKMFRQMHIN